jgi:hypothetical protein
MIGLKTGPVLPQTWGRWVETKVRTMKQEFPGVGLAHERSAFRGLGDQEPVHKRRLCPMLWIASAKVG